MYRYNCPASMVVDLEEVFEEGRIYNVVSGRAIELFRYREIRSSRFLIVSEMLRCEILKIFTHYTET